MMINCDFLNNLHWEMYYISNVFSVIVFKSPIPIYIEQVLPVNPVVICNKCRCHLLSALCVICRAKIPQQIKLFQHTDAH